MVVLKGVFPLALIVRKMSGHSVIQIYTYIESKKASHHNTLRIMHKLKGVVVVQFFYFRFCLNNGGGQIYLIILEIVLTHNLHLERLLASYCSAQLFYSII